MALFGKTCRVYSENVLGNFPLDHNGTGTGASSDGRGFGNTWKDQKTKFTKKDLKARGPHVILEKIWMLLLT